MRTFPFLLIFAFLFSCKTKTTAPVAAVKTQTKEINRYSFVLETEKDFDTIDKNYIIYIKMNFGSRHINLGCNAGELEEKYILFKKKDTSYIQKVAGVAVYYPTKLKSNELINFYITSFSKLKDEKIKHFRDKFNQEVWSAHDTLIKYILITEQGKPITISFTEYDFKKDNHGDKNASYHYNKKLNLFKIDKLLNSEIDELNKQNAFKFRKCRKD